MNEWLTEWMCQWLNDWMTELLTDCLYVAVVFWRNNSCFALYITKFLYVWSSTFYQRLLNLSKTRPQWLTRLKMQPSCHVSESCSCVISTRSSTHGFPKSFHVVDEIMLRPVSFTSLPLKYSSFHQSNLCNASSWRFCQINHKGRDKPELS